MTIDAHCGSLFPTCQSQSVDTASVGVGLLLVTGRTSDPGRRKIVIGMLRCDVRMAAHTKVGLVDRGCQFHFINEDRDFLSVRGRLCEVRIGMAVHAGAVLDHFRSRCNGRDDRKTKEEDIPAEMGARAERHTFRLRNVAKNSLPKLRNPLQKLALRPAPLETGRDGAPLPALPADAARSPARPFLAGLSLPMSGS
jgi:hypothetical protein